MSFAYRSILPRGSRGYELDSTGVFEIHSSFIYTRTVQVAGNVFPEESGSIWVRKELRTELYTYLLHKNKMNRYAELKTIDLVAESYAVRSILFRILGIFGSRWRVSR